VPADVGLALAIAAVDEGGRCAGLKAVHEARRATTTYDSSAMMRSSVRLERRSTSRV